MSTEDKVLGIDTIEKYLQSVADLRRMTYTKEDKYPIFEDWLLKHGQAFGTNIALPDGLDVMEQKACYENSTKTIFLGDVDPEEWFYAEGYAVSDSLGIPLPHAWLVNRKGDVLDRTWTYPPGTCHYFGIPFTEDYLTEESFRSGYYGLFLVDGMMYNLDLMIADEEDYRAWPKQ